jgi:cytidylate kinase
MPVIAMTREMGSQGKNIAIGLAESLGVQIVHHNLVEHDVSDALGCEESDVHHFLEGKIKVLDRFQLKGKKILNYTASEIYHLAEQGNVIIRGWGSAQLLRPVSHVLCIRVCAPIDKRVRTVMERMDIDDPDLARREIELNDTAHERVLSRVSRSNWCDPLLYDLVINTENVAIEDGVELVERLSRLGSFQETPQSRAKLQQLKLESQVRNALAYDTTIKNDSTAINFEVDPLSGTVSLSGGVLRRGTRDKAAQVIGALSGVTDVKNGIQLVHSH